MNVRSTMEEPTDVLGQYNVDMVNYISLVRGTKQGKVIAEDTVLGKDVVDMVVDVMVVIKNRVGAGHTRGVTEPAICSWDLVCRVKYYNVYSMGLDEQHNVVMYLDTMASISLRVRVYVVDNGQNSNVVVNLVTMASLYKRVRVYMVDMWKYNVVEYKMDGDMMLQVYNLVRGTEVDVLKQYDVVGYYVDWVELFLIYNLVRGTKEEATWVQDDVRHAGQVVDVEKYYLMYVGVLVVETTLLWASMERDMLVKMVKMKFFS